MNQTNDFATVEISQVKPTLRDDLLFTLQDYHGQPCYVIEDPSKSRFFRIGVPEYTFISLLDGNTSINDAIYATAAKLGEDAFGGQDAATICKWLVDMNLASTTQSARANRLIDAAETVNKRNRRQWLNPLMLKMPLFNPDPALTRIKPWLHGMLGLPFFAVWMLTVIYALYLVGHNWERAAGASASVLSTENWLWLGLAWISLKACHETFHGLMCKKFGGHVREAGVLLLLLAPIPYVDVTSCWGFRSKWHRIATSAAGMYIELYIAALAAIVWSQTDVGLVNHHAYNVMLLGSLTTLFFNGNPLMRFDGYYILADILEIPNLYSRGQQYVMYLGRRYLVGISVSAPQWPKQQANIIRCYGLASFVWRIFICACLVVAAESLFFGAGIVLAFMAVVVWIGLPTAKFVKYLIRGNDAEKPKLGRFAITLSTAAALIFSLIAVVPWPGAIEAHVVVDYQDAARMRVGAAGFVRELLVSDGDRVAKGDILAKLENPDLKTELEELQLAVWQSDIRARQFHWAGDIAAEQVEMETREALVKRLGEQRRQHEQLIVRAPVAGRIIGDDLNSLIGTYLEEGGELLTIADELKKELRVSISQEDIDRFRANQDQTVSVRLPGTPLGSFSTRINEIDPRASVQIPHPALSAVGGGPVPVKPRRSLADSAEPTGGDDWEFVDPRFLGAVELDADQSVALHVGQIGQLNLRDGRDTVGIHLYNQAKRWFQRRTKSPLLN